MKVGGPALRCDRVPAPQGRSLPSTHQEGLRPDSPLLHLPHGEEDVQHQGVSHQVHY